LLALATEVGKRAPVSGALLKGGSFAAVRRWDESLDAYRDALRINDLATPSSTATEVLIRKRIAIALRTKGDSTAALAEWERVLSLSPGDRDALAGLRVAP
jgi:cytochrome c-type biogenesis protein CcmH/NrfG